MVYLYYMSCLRYTILVGNPRYYVYVAKYVYHNFHSNQQWPKKKGQPYILLVHLSFSVSRALCHPEDKEIVRLPDPSNECTSASPSSSSSCLGASRKRPLVDSTSAETSKDKNDGFVWTMSLSSL